jgi:hypothetical protein
VDFGEEVTAAGEVFEVEELVFFEAMDGLDVALVGVGGGWDTHMDEPLVHWGLHRIQGKNRPTNDRALTPLQQSSRLRRT